MGAPEDPGLFELPDDKTLQEWVKEYEATGGESGISPEQYQETMALRAEVEGGAAPMTPGMTPANAERAAQQSQPAAPVVDNSPSAKYARGDDLPKAEPTAAELAAAYKTPTELVRASGYVPGQGPIPEGREPLEDGAWWSDVMKSLPQIGRDILLTGGGMLPSRGPVYMEPTDEEALAALQADAERRGVREKSTHADMQKWKDKQWADAYDDAQNRGVAIYRGRDINDNSPSFMQIARNTAEYYGRGTETFLRKADENAAFGMGFNAIDEETLTRGPQRWVRRNLEGVGVAPPSFLGSEADDAAVARRNVTQGARTVEDQPVAGFLGSMAGALLPESAGAQLGKVIGSGMQRISPGRGVVSGAIKGAIESGVGGAAETLTTSWLREGVREAAGLAPRTLGDRLMEAGTGGAVSGVIGGGLSIPKGASRGMREGNNATSGAHATLEEGTDLPSTDFWTVKGLRAPPDHERLRSDDPKLGSYAVARSEAANEAADDIMGAAERTQWSIGEGSEDIVSDLVREHGEMNARVRGIADKAVGDNQSVDRVTDEMSLRFTNRLMNRVDAERVQRKSRMAAETEEAMQFEGVPDQPPIPGPNMHISEIEAMQSEAKQSDYGLTTDYPSISAEPIINKAHTILQELKYQDGTNMPSAAHQKFKELVDSLYETKIVSPEEASIFDDVGHNMVSLPDGNVEITKPRLLHARELTNFIRGADDMSKWADANASPDAARYRALGATARDLREQANEVLAGVQGQHHMDMLENERMLRSIGLPANLDEVNPGDIDQVQAVLGNVRRIANEYDLKTPEGLAIPKKEFENWLEKFDPELNQEYLTMRGMAAQQRNANSFDITVGAAPKTQAASYKQIEDAVLGRDREADAVLMSFKSVQEQVEVARAQQTKFRDVFNILGVDGDMRAMSPDKRHKLSVGVNQAMLKGGSEFDRLRAQLKPEQQKMMDIGRQAAADTDSMFRTLGFGPQHNKPGFDTATREQVVDGLHEAFDAFEKFNGKQDFDREVNKIFMKTPAVRLALKRMTKERAFQFLDGSLKEDAKLLFGETRPWHGFVTDFAQNHLDAMVSRKKKNLVNPFDVPAPYAIGLSSPSEDDPNRTNTPDRISVVKALQALSRMAALATKEEKEKKP